MANVGDRVIANNITLYVKDYYDAEVDKYNKLAFMLALVSGGMALMKKNIEGSLSKSLANKVSPSINAYTAAVTFATTVHAILGGQTFVKIPRSIVIKNITYVYAMDDMGYDAKWLLVNYDTEINY